MLSVLKNFTLELLQLRINFSAQLCFVCLLQLSASGFFGFNRKNKPKTGSQVSIQTKKRKKQTATVCNVGVGIDKSQL